jgi:hypothetical protein
MRFLGWLLIFIGAGVFASNIHIGAVFLLGWAILMLTNIEE